MTIALVVYDYLLTIEDEVQLIWRRKTSSASLLFLANRVTSLILIVDLFLVNVSVTVSS